MKTMLPLHSFYLSFLLVCGLMSLTYSFQKAAVTTSTTTRGCSQVERDALLAFKANVEDPSHRLASWSPPIDCCKWTGVVCNTTNNATHVVELNLQNPNIDYYDDYDTALRGEMLSPSLLNLTRLERLNLSRNDFQGTPIPQFIGSFQKLKYLELYQSNFSGVIPSQLGNLSNLYHLGLQSFGIAHRLDWLSGLSSLRYVDLTYVDLSTVSQNWLSDVNMLPSLQKLYLSRCDLNYIPSSFNLHLNLTSLQILDIGGNPFSYSSSLPNWLWRLTNLSSLAIDASGLIPAGISNLTTLIQLHIHGNISSPLPVEIWSLNHLIELDLSYNEMITDPIPVENIANLTSLQSLFLSRCSLNGQIPSEIGNLTSLTSLDLSSNSLSSPIPSEIGNLNSLTSLELSFNSLSGLIPTEIENLTSLTSLDLSSNSLSGLIPSEIGNLTSLTSLDLSSNSLLGLIPSEIRNLTSLTSLDLSSNSLSGLIPSKIGNFTNLISLNLFNNSLSGPIPSEIGNLNSLTSLDLTYNSLSGLIPSKIGYLNSLTSLELYSNSLSGPIPIEIGNLTSLISLYLSSNSLSGSIPTEIWELSNLQDLDLSFNSLVSVVSETHLANLTNLKTLALSKNSRINISLEYDWVPSFQLENIDLTSCIVGPRFPQWLRSQKSIYVLSLSNTSIDDVLPHWFWDLSSSTFWIIDLSRNNISGTLPSSLESMPRLDTLILSYNKLEGLIPRRTSNIWVIDLSFNNFSGPIPSKISRAPFFLILSNNRINGSIPSSICKWEHLCSLDLSHNKLSGEIPKCWQETNTCLYFISLGNNKLTGGIPSSIGNLIELRSLHLENNNLSGLLPKSLQNCTQLQVIDLAGNNFVGSIPMWIGQSLLQLTALILRSNMFSGIIPSSLGQLSNLQILDLANNNLTGSIPYSFGNFSAIRSTSRVMDAPYLFRVITEYATFGENDSVSIVTKGYEYVFSSTLYLVKLIDISNNSLTGELPMSLGSLEGLQTLNLSRNFLRGRILYTIGGMKLLETLDLSFNNLSGVIPQDLSKLTFLDHLNLSYNNLSGDIPSGYQLQTLQDASIYMGNAHLCGALINKSCFDDVDSNVTKEELQKSTSQIFLSIYFGVSLGYAIGLWSVFIILLSNQNWRNLYFHLIDRVFVQVHIPLYRRRR